MLGRTAICLILALWYVQGVEGLESPEKRHIRQGTSSWYNRASCRREGTSGVMANGKELRDEAFTAASWDYPLGTHLSVSRGIRKVQVIVADRGPSRHLYRHGRILDLSQAAFHALAPLSRGLIRVEIEEVNAR